MSAEQHSLFTDARPLYGDLPEWQKALRAIVVAGELGCPPQGLARVARKALEDEGTPYPTPEEIARGY